MKTPQKGQQKQNKNTKPNVATCSEGATMRDNNKYRKISIKSPL